MFKELFIAVFLSVLIIGCNNSPAGSQAVSQPSPNQIKGQLLARVNKWSIGTVDFQDKLKALKALIPQENLQAQINDPATKKQILGELVNLEILAQTAEAKGMSNDPEVIAAVREFKRNFLAQKFLADLYRNITVSDMEIETFYNTNKLIFREPEQRKIREIATLSEPQIKDISIKLLQGDDFSYLARMYSIADSKDKGGDLGYLKIDEETTQKEKFPKFWQAALATEEGKVSGYFQGPDNRFYIIKVEKINNGTVQSLSEVRDKIREHLRGTQANRKREDVVFDAKQKFRVTINEDLLE